MKHDIGTPTGIDFNELFQIRNGLEQKQIDQVSKCADLAYDKEQADCANYDVLCLYDMDEDRVRREMENDPEVIENSTDGNHPAVVHYSDMLEQVWEKQDQIRKVLGKPTLKMQIAQNKLVTIEKMITENKNQIAQAWAQLNQ